MPALTKSTVLDYRLPQTVEYIQQSWLNTCQNSAVTSGLLTVVGTLLLLFFTNSQYSSQDPRFPVFALEILGYASIFLNISACMSCFILLDRLGEVPYHASRDSNIPTAGRIVLEQEGILRIYGIGALWQWVVWHWLFCFITGAWCIVAQLLVFVWLQESRKTRIGLTALAIFCILPFVAFILAPIVNRVRGAKKAEAESFSNVESRRTSTGMRTPTSPMTPVTMHNHIPIPALRGPTSPQRPRHQSTLSSYNKP